MREHMVVDPPIKIFDPEAARPSCLILHRRVRKERVLQEGRENARFYRS
jgi:hypothetical protein